jgi:hypothetical protein
VPGRHKFEPDPRLKLLFTVLKFAVFLLDPLAFMLFRLVASNYTACGSAKHSVVPCVVAGNTTHDGPSALSVRRRCTEG